MNVRSLFLVFAGLLSSSFAMAMGAGAPKALQPQPGMTLISAVTDHGSACDVLYPSAGNYDPITNGQAYGLFDNTYYTMIAGPENEGGKREIGGSVTCDGNSCSWFTGATFQSYRRISFEWDETHMRVSIQKVNALGGEGQWKTTECTRK